jgi:hypothetical protein
MRSSAGPVARRATSIHARSHVFSMPPEICSAPVPIAVGLWMNPATALISAGAGVRRGGKLRSLPIAF